MKKVRHEMIIELVKNNIIDTQEDLAKLLIDNGFVVTQATVSRDIRELNLSKVTYEKGKQKYIILETKDDKLEEKYARILRDGYISMDIAMNILVIKTVPGMAMAVAAAVDSMDWEEMVGSIAGDDTIMCAIRSLEEVESVIEKIHKVVG